MVTTEEVLRVLEGVQDPELGGNVVELGMITDVRIDGDHVEVGLALTIAECPLRNQLENDTMRRVEMMPGVGSVQVRTTAMTKRQRAELMSTVRKRARAEAAPTRVSPATRVIAVASGKGGVGKSTVSVNLAAALADAGYSVGLIDADIWGFSVPRMLGVDGRLEADAGSTLIIPAESRGVKVVSTGLIIDSEETALMWRGLMLSKALEQFLTQVDWGELDYLLVDMPPGTGDVQMALPRLLPQAEMLVVTTPQMTAQKVAIRVADMARRSFMPIVGVVENMSGDVFGAGGGDELASTLEVPMLGSIPLDRDAVPAGDSGVPIVIANPTGSAGSAIREIAARLVGVLPPVRLDTCTGRIARLIEEADAALQMAAEPVAGFAKGD